MRTNYAATTKARCAACVLALVTSSTVLGASVFGMQPRYEGASPRLIALERVVVSAPAVNCVPAPRARHINPEPGIDRALLLHVVGRKAGLDAQGDRDGADRHSPEA